MVSRTKHTNGMLIYSPGFLSYTYKHQTEKRRPRLSVVISITRLQIPQCLWPHVRLDPGPEESKKKKKEKRKAHRTFRCQILQRGGVVGSSGVGAVLVSRQGRRTRLSLGVWIGNSVGGSLGRGRSLCWPAKCADGDIRGTKSYSQMVQKTIFRSTEGGKQNSAIR